MGRREGRTTRREDNPRNGSRKGRGGGLFAGLLIGLTMGIAIAAGVAWYLNMGSTPMKTVETPVVTDPPEIEAEAPPFLAEAPVAPPPLEDTPPPAPKPAPPPVAVKAQPKPLPAPQSAPRTRTSPPPKVNYTFYGILPGDKPTRPMDPPPSKDIWWLQIAALSDQEKADQIRAKLVLLNLRASTQQIVSNGQPLYRIRVGPYKREDDAFGDLDVLTENNYYARLLKETAQPQ